MGSNRAAMGSRVTRHSRATRLATEASREEEAPSPIHRKGLAMPHVEREHIKDTRRQPAQAVLSHA